MYRILVACLVALSLGCASAPPEDSRPNVIVVITDDQGYGDVAAHGNSVIQTPNLDQLRSESVSLTDFHVDPTCAPTRSALLSGRYSSRTGVWHTIAGRSLLHREETLMGRLFSDAGYRTGMFGKWHLGANAPLRPMDQGFEHCVWAPGGAINQGANYLGNDCFDDTYKVNDKWQKFPGYYTDVFFDQAMKFIEKKDDKPFFIYLPTPAVHDPWNIGDDAAKAYIDKGVPPTMAKFYAMITNIDDNLGKLRAFLKDKGLAENTILIFTTDNGTTAGWIDRDSDFKYFNDGMRGWKGSEYDGGHRVPFFIHWPKGGLDEGRDVDTLAAHIDVFPTLVSLTSRQQKQQDVRGRGPMDGDSLVGENMRSGLQNPDRVLFVHSQRTQHPIKWRKSAVMTEQYRLVNGEELYDIVKDPGQQNDIAQDHPGVVKQLRAEYDRWWDSLKPVFDDVVRFDLGGAQNPTTLMSHDWFMEGTTGSAWHHVHVRRNELRNGPFMVNIVKPGTYRITPRRWPAYVDEPSGVVKAKVAVRVAGEQSAAGDGLIIHNAIQVDPDKPVTALTLDLPAGPASLVATLTRPDGEIFGAYYVQVERVGPAKP